MEKLKGSIGGFAIGLVILMLCFFLIGNAGTVFPSFTRTTLDIFSIGILLLGFVAVFIGIRSRGV